MASSNVTPLRVALVGCNMGRNQAIALENLKEYEFVAVCDINEEAARNVAETTEKAQVYLDYATMLNEVKPDIVVIATPTNTHTPFTLQAIKAGVKGVYCEKPMATNLADAKKMVDECRNNNVKLAIGHQRRLDSIFLTARKLIEEGVLGDVKLVRGSCQGDLLSDGTHTVDTILHLLGEKEVKWVFGQIERKPPASKEEVVANKWAFTGHRYGHVVESGAMAIIEFEGGIRAEILTGDLILPGSNYQEFEVIGTKGRLRRKGDSADPALLVAIDGVHGFEPVTIENSVGVLGFESVFLQFADMINHDAAFPISGAHAIRSFEVLMAIFESSRLRKRISLPLNQDRFPLEILIEEGQI